MKLHEFFVVNPPQKKNFFLNVYNEDMFTIEIEA